MTPEEYLITKRPATMKEAASNELALTHTHVYLHLASARVLVTLWKQLTGSRETGVLWDELCPNAMPHVVRAIQREAVLALCRISDPKDNRHGHGCTFQRLAEAAETCGHKELSERLKLKEPDVPGLAEIRRARNKWISHLNYEANVGYLEKADPEKSEREKSLSLESVESVLTHFRGLLRDYETTFKPDSVDAEDRVSDDVNEVRLPDGGFLRLIEILKDVKAGRPAKWPIGSVPDKDGVPPDIPTD